CRRSARCRPPRSSPTNPKRIHIGHGGPMHNANLNLKVATRYVAECFSHHHVNGERCPQPWDCREYHVRELAWREDFHNLVVTEGLNELLGARFDAVAADVNWYVGLIGAGTGNVDITSGAAAIT